MFAWLGRGVTQHFGHLQDEQGHRSDGGCARWAFLWTVQCLFRQRAAAVLR